MKKLRVVQWNTGKVGKLALRAILDDPRLELAGLYAYSKDKAGSDAGKLCGRPDTGIHATGDIDALIALQPDSVIYTPFVAELPHVIRLLESGIDVISTNLFLNVGGIRGAVKQQLEAACQRGGSSLHISGINPGWINSVTTATTAVCRQVDSIAIVESANCATYESVETWLTMGMSLPAATPEVIESARKWLILFYDAVERMAEALAFELDDIEFFIEYATASQRVDLGWFCMEKDTNAAVRAGWNGKIKGHTVVQSKIVWYLTKHLNQNWDIDDDQYHLTVKGEPDVDVRIRFTAPKHWGNHEWDTMTALPAVSAVPTVWQAKPGILGLKDAGLPCAPAGLWLQGRA